MNWMRSLVALSLLASLSACATPQEQAQRDRERAQRDREYRRERAAREQRLADEDALRAEEDAQRDRDDARERAQRDREYAREDERRMQEKYQRFLEDFAYDLGKPPAQLTTAERQRAYREFWR